MSATRAIARRAFADSRTRNISFALLFAFVAYANVVGYRDTYPTLADRLGFAHAFGGNASIRLFYGRPYDLLTTGGYSAWRVGGLLSIFAAMWGVLAAVKALRTEEDTGRREIVLAGVVSRRQVYLAALAAIGAGAAGLWLAVFAGLVAAQLPVGGSAYLALAVIAAVPVFAGVGALASQLAPTSRIALELSSAVLTVALLVRVIADTSSSLEWLRWATPLGWAEELRPFTGTHAWVLLLPLTASAALLVGAGAHRRPARRGQRAASEQRQRRAAPAPALLTDRTRAAWRVGQLRRLDVRHRLLRPHNRPDLHEHLLGGRSGHARAAAAEARRNLAHEALGVHRPDVPLLHPRRQPVCVLADRGGPT